MAAMTSWIRRLGRSEDGAELIEMAIVTPLFLLMVAGIINFGFLFRTWEATTNAAREGARVGVLAGFGCADDGPAEARVAAYLTTSGIAAPTAAEVVVHPVTIPFAGGNLSACQVDVTVPQGMGALGIAMGLFGGSMNTINLHASSVMRTEVQAGP